MTGINGFTGYTQAAEVLVALKQSLLPECYRFVSWVSGTAGKEWEELVLPVIQRWARFVERHLPDPEEQLETQSFFVSPRIFIFCLCVYVFYCTVK